MNSLKVLTESFAWWRFSVLWQEGVTFHLAMRKPQQQAVYEHVVVISLQFNWRNA
jgi:hypothetical protein